MSQTPPCARGTSSKILCRLGHWVLTLTEENGGAGWDTQEEDEDDGDDDTHDLIADEKDEAELAAAENRSAAQRLANQQRQNDVFGTDEELERLIQERYGAQAAAGYGEEDNTGEGTEVEQQAMLPTVKVRAPLHPSSRAVGDSVVLV